MKIRKYQGAGIALFCKGPEGYEILLGKRSVSKDFGKWSIPGGAKEGCDKSFKEAAMREFKEETGINIKDISSFLCDKTIFVFPFFKWVTYFYITKRNNFPFNPSEFSELKWINVKKIKEYELCFGVKREVRRFEKLIEKRKI